MRKHWVTGLVLLGLAGAFAGTLRRPEPVIMKKYTNQVARPALTGTRGVPRGMKAQLDKLFSVAGKSVWVNRGPDADQTVVSGSSAYVNDCAITDHFPRGLYLVTFRCQVNTGPAPGATASLSIRLDGSATLSDHTTQSQTISGISVEDIGSLSLIEVVPITEGAHAFSVLAAVASGGSGATIPANTAMIIVQQL